MEFKETPTIEKSEDLKDDKTSTAKTI